MKDNQQTLQWLFDSGRIDLRRGPIFDLDPGPMPASFDFDRVEGMMLGLAIGDSLGNTSEGMNPQERHARWGEIRDYLSHSVLGEARGYPTDDTQMAFWTLEQMIADGEFDPEHVAATFCSGHIFGIGSAVREFIRNCKDRKKPWYECGPKSAGNGALMRIAPMVIPHLKTGTSRLWADAALSAMLTHNDSGSIAACISFVRMLWLLLWMKTPPPAEWWLDSYVQVASELEIGEGYRPRGGDFLDYRGPIWRFAQERLSEAYAKGQSALEACNSWHSGAYLLETMPSVLYILMLYGHDPEEAIIRAVNDTRDNDTVAAIVGAAVGALHGRDKLPERWVSRLSGRTRADDDGRLFDLLAEARPPRFAE